jgi:hypothetical protein
VETGLSLFGERKTGQDVRSENGKKKNKKTKTKNV